MAKPRRPARAKPPAKEQPAPLSYATPAAAAPLTPPTPAALGPVLEWLFLGYFAILVFGFVLLRLRGTTASGNEFNVDRAMFTAIDAATLTGFQLDVGVSQFKPGAAAGPAALLLLTAGGTFFTLVIGGLLAVRILGMRYTPGQVALAAACAIGAAAVGGAVPLVLIGQGQGQGRSLSDALLLAAAAFGNSGAHTGPLPAVADGLTHLVLLPLAVLGGLGLPVLMELYDRLLNRRPLSGYSKTILLLTAAFYAVGTLLLLLVREPFWDDLVGGLTDGGWTPAQGLALRRAVASSSAAAINGRTLGLPLEYASALPRASQWVLLALMAVGANPAGTGGGLKTTNVLQLVRSVRDVLARRMPPRSFGIAAAWLAAYLLIVAVGFLTLLVQVPQMPADQLLFLSVSAASNVGLSHDALSLVVGPLVTLSLVMLLGRVAPMLVLWWMAETTREGEAGMPVA